MMDDNHRDVEDDDEFDEQIERVMIENTLLVQSLAALLVKKGVLKQEEIDAEMDRLYASMEEFDRGEGE